MNDAHVPVQATRYDYNDDFASVDIFLRDGVTWGDGVWGDQIIGIYHGGKVG